MAKRKNKNVLALSGYISQLNLNDKARFKNMMNINMLSDNMLENIFKHLNNDSELIKMEQVCHKWKKVCYNIWSKKRTLQLKNFLEFDTFESVIFRWGSNLKALEYAVTKFYICSHCSEEHGVPEDFYLDFNDRIIRPIIQHCSNLTELSLIGLHKVKPTMLKKLAKCSFIANLKLLNLSNVEISDDILKIILHKAVSLKQLSLNSSPILEGHSLMKLSKECELLVVSGCDCLEEEVLSNVLPRLHKLKIFGACNVEILSLSMLMHQINLVELSVTDAEIFKGKINTIDFKDQQRPKPKITLF